MDAASKHTWWLARPHWGGSADQSTRLAGSLGTPGSKHACFSVEGLSMPACTIRSRPSREVDKHTLTSGSLSETNWLKALRSQPSNPTDDKQLFAYPAECGPVVFSLSSSSDSSLVDQSSMMALCSAASGAAKRGAGIACSWQQLSSTAQSCDLSPCGLLHKTQQAPATSKSSPCRT